MPGIMEITPENLKGLVQKNFDAQLSEQRGTWAPGSQKRKDLDDLLHFYRNSFARGIIEFAEAERITTPMRPYPFNQGGFYPRWFLTEYLYSKLTAKHRKRMYRRDFDILRAAGIKFPAFNPEHADIFYNFDGNAFNFEMRKFGADIALMKQYMRPSGERGSTEASRPNVRRGIKNICEIGAGYGGMCEMLAVNQPFERYLIIDLFETLSVSMTYILNAPTFKGFRFFYIESADDVKNLPLRSIAFISYKTFHKNPGVLKTLPLELFINISSFVEMGQTIVGEYFNFIQSYGDVYLFSANNMKRDEQGEPFGAYDFPYDKKWEHLCDVPNSHLKSELSRLSHRKAK
ncbi:MAG: putative sugar O-methyltransferase [bacterium]|nr:putative sugar O-methyltransferase [bacterium]